MEPMVIDIPMSVQPTVHSNDAAQEHARSELQDGVNAGTPGMVLTVDPRTRHVPHRTILVHASASRSLDAVVSPSHGSHNCRRVHEEVPVEIWLLIFKDLSRVDLLSLLRVSSHIGAVAETPFYREVKLRPLAVKTWTMAMSQPVSHHRATAVRSLTISLDGLTRLSQSANTLLHLAGALSSLPDLRELTISGARPHKDTVWNILPGINFSWLKRFACNSDTIVLACWPALAVQSELEEFWGLHDYATYIPVEVVPRVWPNLRILDACAIFVERLTGGSKVTCLSIHVPRATAVSILARILQTLGEQLIKLQVIRTILCPHSSGSDWATVGSEPYWESDSPVVLCTALCTPVLKLFELWDMLSAGTEWSTDIETLWEWRTFGPVFRAVQRAECTPALKTILWQPVWADTAHLFPVIACNHVLDMFTLLLVYGVGMPLVRYIQNLAGVEGEGWSFWEKLRSGVRAPGPPAWWEGRGTVVQKDKYVPLEGLWAKTK